MRFWRTLETFAKPSAVLAEWQLLTADEFNNARPFLVGSNRQSDTFPCTNQPPCGWRHEIELSDCSLSLRAVSRNDAVKCGTIFLQPHDVLIHELDTAKLCGAICRAMSFELGTANGSSLSARSHTVGIRGAARSPVLLTIANSESALLQEIESLLAVVAAPFILLTPTPAHCTLRVDGVLRRNSCVVIPLSSTLQIGERGNLILREVIDGTLMAFDQRLAAGPGLLKTVEKIGKDLDAVARGMHELKTAKARLEAMQAEGLFKVVGKLDAETFKQFCTILSVGDVAKASRALGMADSTLREVMRGWPKRGKAYAMLADLVRWRKKVGGKDKVPLNEAIFQEQTPSADYPALISDVLDGLLSMTEGNWEDTCNELSELLRPHVPR